MACNINAFCYCIVHNNIKKAVNLNAIYQYGFISCKMTAIAMLMPFKGINWRIRMKEKSDVKFRPNIPLYWEPGIEGGLFRDREREQEHKTDNLATLSIKTMQNMLPTSQSSAEFLKQNFLVELLGQPNVLTIQSIWELLGRCPAYAVHLRFNHFLLFLGEGCGLEVEH